MAIPASSSQSHILRNSTASLIRTAEEILSTPDGLPRLCEKYRETQRESPLMQLPPEIEFQVLSVCSKASPPSTLVNLGLTSKYGHLRVRDFIEHEKPGAAFRRARDHERFVQHFGASPVETAKEKIRLWRAAFTQSRDASSEAKLAAKTLPNSKVFRTQWFEKKELDLKTTLAGRNGCLTVLEGQPKAPSAGLLIDAVRATPLNAFLALVFPPEGIPANDAQALAITIKEHPVVSLVKVYADCDVRNPLEVNVSLLKACADQKVEGMVFNIEYGRMSKTEAEQLAHAIRAFKTSVSIEISAGATSPEYMSLIFDAVRSRNQDSQSAVNLICNGPAISAASGDGNTRPSPTEGISFINFIDRESEVDNIIEDYLRRLEGRIAPDDDY